MSGETALPCPPLPWQIAIAPGCDLSAALASLPARPGVFAILNNDCRALCLATTSNLRRQCRARLERLRAAGDNHAGPPPFVDVERGLTVAACTVGSRFEADWAYLQHARVLMPHSYASLLDQWRGWFVHCNPDSAFPQFVKTSSPGSPPTGRGGIYLGPLADKHAAQRLIDALVSTFDLCRYHHILVQAPHGSACAYKEMGRCPAPCDGSVTMAHYHSQVRAAIACAAAPDRWRAEIQSEMNRASAAREFETAARLMRVLEDASDLARAEFRMVRPLTEFRYLAVMPSERAGHARLFLIDRGWIAPFMDLSLDTPAGDVASLLDDSTLSPPGTWRFDFQPQAIENFGLVCSHLLRRTAGRTRRSAPPADSTTRRMTKRPRVVPAGEFLAMDRAPDAELIQRALRRLRRGAPVMPADAEQVADHSLDMSS